MEKRYFIALLLAAVVVALTQFLFPVTRPPASTIPRRDTTLVSPNPSSIAQPETSSNAPIVRAQVAQPTNDSTAKVNSAELVTVDTNRSIYQFSNVGATPVSVALKEYKNLAPAGGLVELKALGSPLIKYDLVLHGDTIALERVPFKLTRSSNGENVVLSYDAIVQGAHLTIAYEILTGQYVVHVKSRVEGATGRTYILIGLPNTLRPAESDTVGDLRNLAYSFKPQRENARIVSFSKLEPGEQKLEPGPLAWAAVKNKYFVVGLLAPTGSAFSEVTLKGGARTSKLATNASATIVDVISNESFAMDLYAGPQQSTQLIAMGRDFDHVNPYGWHFLQGVVQPIAALCIRLLLWMHQVLQLSYGWVLVIFGIFIRIALWPLNQSAMRSSMKMQEIQPRLAEVQKKYKDKPDKQREEIMKVYKEAGASPFTALTGCLPALIPMPVLFALFFVFQNTIEFRGVPFLWLHDISVKDPIYILPILMGISMYFLSWIGLRNAPPNPQAKMMSYMFPVMMTFVLANMASGLNLYYTAQNIAALPQQWLLAKERARRSRTG